MGKEDDEIRLAAKAARSARRAEKKAAVIAAAEKHAPAMHERRKVRLESSTESALAYLMGLFDPFGAGRGMRRPDDGVTPTSVITGLQRKFEAPIVTGTAGQLQALWMYAIWPDMHFAYKKVASFLTPGGYPLTWGSFVNGPAWATLSAASSAYRGVVNCAVKVKFMGADVSRGGSLFVCFLPPNATLPATLDDVLTSPGTQVYDIKSFPAEMVFPWLPATGESPIAATAGLNYRTGSQWATVAADTDCIGDNRIVIGAFANIGYNATTPVLGAVDVTAVVEIIWNSEFQPLFGNNQNIYPGKIAAGGPADVERVLKPVEAQLSTGILPRVLSSPVLQDVAIGALRNVSVGAAQYAQEMARTLKMSGKGGDLVSRHIAKASGVSALAGASASALGGNWKQAGWDVADFAGSMMSLLSYQRHQMAVNAGVPYLSPLNNYGQYDPNFRKPVDDAKNSPDNVQFLMLLLDGIKERAEMELDLEYPDRPPPGSRFLSNCRLKPAVANTPPGVIVPVPVTTAAHDVRGRSLWDAYRTAAAD